MRCKKCKVVGYCSKPCRSGDSKHHKEDCSRRKTARKHWGTRKQREKPEKTAAASAKTTTSLPQDSDESCGTEPCKDPRHQPTAATATAAAVPTPYVLTRAPLVLAMAGIRA